VHNSTDTAHLTELDQLLQESETNVADDYAPHYRAASVFAAQSRERDRVHRYLRKYLSQEPEAREPTHAEAEQLLRRIK
jgi:hypothetical protein